MTKLRLLSDEDQLSPLRSSQQAKLRNPHRCHPVKDTTPLRIITQIVLDIIIILTLCV